MSPPPRPALSAIPSVTSATVAELRRQIERLEGSAQARAPLPFGIAAIDNHLPGGGLACGALHEVVKAGPAAEFASSTTLFTAGIAARLKGPVLWCLTRRDLFAPGLASAGLLPSRVIYAEAYRDRDVLPLVEEGLRERVSGRCRRGDPPDSDSLAPLAVGSGRVWRHRAAAAALVDRHREGSGCPALGRRHAMAHRTRPVRAHPCPGPRPRPVAGRPRALPRRPRS
jgi:hypothetical protein